MATIPNGVQVNGHINGNLSTSNSLHNLVDHSSVTHFIGELNRFQIRWGGFIEPMNLFQS